MNRKNTSIVWQYFDKRSPDLAFCLLCRNVYKCRGNTSNLRDHLKRKHSTVFQHASEPQDVDEPCELIPATISHTEAEPVPSTSSASAIQISSVSIPGIKSVPSIASTKRMSRQLTLTGTMRSKELSAQNIRRLNGLVVQMIAKDFQPLSIVENKGFQNLIKELEPRYVLPSRRVLTRSHLPDMYNSVKEILREELQSVSHVSITTDIWTSVHNCSFITVTVHFFDCNLDLRSNVLATKELSMQHTGLYLSNVLRDILKYWDILDRVVAVVTDGAPNIISAVNQLELSHLPCTAHMLNLVVQHSISNTKSMDNLLKTCRALVTHFKSSVVASDKLKSVQTQMGIDLLKLKKDVPTRWNSIFIMLERLLCVKEPLSAALASLPKSPAALTSDQWTEVEECIQLLKPLELMTTELSGEKYPTVSMIIPLVRGLKLSLTNKSPKTITGIALKGNLLNEIGKRLGEVEQKDIPAAATLLDPRFKNVAFETENNAENGKKYLIEKLTALCCFTAMSTREEPISGNSSQESRFTSNEESLWGFLDARVCDLVVSENPENILRQYLELPYETRKTNPMIFWKKNQHVLEQLCQLALKYLSVPATSVPSERIFSKAGQIMCDSRNRLMGKHLDMLIFLNNNE